VGSQNWIVQYYRGPTVDPKREVTSLVISSLGWKRANVPPGGQEDFLIVVTAGPSPVQTLDVLVTAQSDQDALQLDAIRAVTSVPQVQPDLWIKQGLYWLGDDVYNEEGTDQTSQRQVTAGKTAAYSGVLLNDGNQTETFWIQGPAGDADWTVKYYQGSKDVTAEVTSAQGWKRPNVPPEGMRTFTIKVTPRSGLAVRQSFPVLVRAEAALDPVQCDAILALTQVK
jgi:hypothetical protein